MARKQRIKAAYSGGENLADPVSVAPSFPSNNTVRMVREKPQFVGGPLTADVSLDEIVNYESHGWSLEEEKS